MPLKITKIGHPLLRKSLSRIAGSSFVEKKWKKKIREMFETMLHADGVGLAANQVAINARLIVLGSQENPRYPSKNDVPYQVYFNPRITKKSSRMVTDWEGCLSIPGYRGQVPRHQWVEFVADLPDGRKVKRRVKDFEARIVQHEVDHINGFFYIDRMKPRAPWVHVEWFGLKEGPEGE